MNQYDTKLFRKDLEDLGVSLSEKQICQFLRYYELLLEWNQKINLTAIKEYHDILKKHFIDSISLVKAYDITKSNTVIDVGTGAGFPGLALKIAYPDLEVTLLDSLKKRILFLDTVTEDLSLSGVKTIHGRAEDYARSEMYREKFDLCVSRAVANLTTLSEYCVPFVKLKGCFIAYKSEKISEEIVEAEYAISLFGAKVKNQVEFILPNSDIYRNLIVIEKVSKTPDPFPRKAGLPEKRPIKEIS